jgi:uncharacterized protein YjdB
MNSSLLRHPALVLACIILTTSTCTDSGLSAPAMRVGDGLRVSPKSLDLVVDQSAAVSVTSEGQSGGMPPQVQWSNSNPEVARVSHDGVVTAVGPGTVILVARAGQMKDSVNVRVRPITRVQAAPGTVVLKAIGATRQLTATAYDDRNTAAGTRLTWRALNVHIADVDSMGNVAARSAGVAYMVVSAGCCNVADTVQVNVDPAVHVVAVSPSAAILKVAESLPLQASATDPNGHPNHKPVTWSSSNAAVATVSSTGTVSAHKAGTVTITASAEGVSGHTNLTVQNVPVAAVEATPGAVSLVVGASQQMSVIAHDVGGAVLTGRSFTWASTNSAVATITQAGLVTGAGAGVAEIVVMSEGVNARVPVTVQLPPVHTVSVTPSSTSIQQGSTQQLVTTLRDAGSNVLTGRAVMYSSNAPGVASVSQAGLITGEAPGSAIITVASEGKAAYATVTITTSPPAAVATVSISPVAPWLEAGATMQLSATARDGHGNILTGRAVTWSSTSPAIASVTASGVLTGLAAGTTTIAATIDGRTEQATVTVTAVQPPPPAPAAVASVTVSPSAPSVQVGATVQLVATLKDSDGNMLSGRTVTWSSSNPAVASVSAAGLVSGVAAGAAAVTATSEGKSAQVAVTVTAPPPAAVASITISPSAPSLQTGATIQLTATLKDASGNTLTGRNVSWSASNVSVATVSATGLVTAMGAGSAMVTAASEGKSSQVAVTVSTAAGVYQVPATIKTDCSVDVTASLLTWIASVPDNSTLVFGRNACYIIDQGLDIRDRHGLTFEGNGATFKFTTQGWGQRSNWHIRGGSNYTWRNMTVIGANPNAGLASEAYVRSLEWQHAWRFRGTQGALLDNVEAYDVYGDFVNVSFDDRVPYPGPPTRHITVRNSRFERNGRYGWTITHGERIVFENNYMGDVRWSAVNIELNHSVDLGRDVRIEGNRFGPTLHHMFVAKGAGLSESVGDIVIRGNVMEPTHQATCLAAVAVRSPASDRFWSGWTVEGNTFRTRNQGRAIELDRTRNVTVRSNSVISGAAGGCGLNDPMRFSDSHVGAVVDNTIIGAWPELYSTDDLTTGFTFASNVKQ